MSILIKDMEMPTDGGTICVYKVRGKFFAARAGKNELFPIIPINEPHGRLIDADAIPYKKIMYDDDDFYYGVTKPYIDRIPTVIPASDEGKT